MWRSWPNRKTINMIFRARLLWPASWKRMSAHKQSPSAPMNQNAPANPAPILQVFALVPFKNPSLFNLPTSLWSTIFNFPGVTSVKTSFIAQHVSDLRNKILLSDLRNKHRRQLSGGRANLLYNDFLWPTHFFIPPPSASGSALAPGTHHLQMGSLWEREVRNMRVCHTVWKSPRHTTATNNQPFRRRQHWRDMCVPWWRCWVVAEQWTHCRWWGKSVVATAHPSVTKFGMFDRCSNLKWIFGKNLFKCFRKHTVLCWSYICFWPLLTE